MPPKDPTDRANHCLHGTSHMWRKPGEAAHPDLAGAEPYHQQLPLERAIPIWGGISQGGIAIVTFHKRRKITTDEWVNVVASGQLRRAIRSLDPVRPAGPWCVLCDGEKFLHTRASKAAYAAQGVETWKVPPKSPDLSPVEKFWSWLRRDLRQKDLTDLRARRPLLSKAQYKARVRAVCASARARRVAANVATGFPAACQEVVTKEGQRPRG